MGAFKNEKNGTWYVQFRYTDWQGLRQQKLKRGFATKREAQEWERAFLTEKKADVTMPFKTFTELYEKDVRPKLKENTWLTKEHIIKTKILPYFEHKRLCDISAKDVIAWQNEIRKQTNSSGEPFSQGYLKTIHNQLSSLFNHAIKIYGLRLNPASTVGNMGKEERKEMSYWTVEEYSKFSDEMMDKPISYYAFQMLYWTGIHIYIRQNKTKWQIHLMNYGRRESNMSLKNKDEHNRWRNKTVAFRVSPEEWEQIERYVQLSGLTKQDYITRRLINKEVVVQGNPRVYKALRNNLADVLTELQRIENGGEVNDELLDLIEMIADILGGLKEVSE